HYWLLKLVLQLQYFNELLTFSGLHIFTFASGNSRMNTNEKTATLLRPPEKLPKRTAKVIQNFNSAKTFSLFFRHPAIPRTSPLLRMQR
ncbi:hypothetical protein, partial [uncultured Rikenella sp.]|uniref:hypothetical protein n=1 Tax=uncultured Rikenella sp. TaxID=368003 RepID=UPI0026343217